MSVYHRILFKMLAILLMETLGLSWQPINSAIESMRRVENISRSNDLNGHNILEMSSVIIELVERKRNNINPEKPSLNDNMPAAYRGGDPQGISRSPGDRVEAGPRAYKPDGRQQTEENERMDKDIPIAERNVTVPAALKSEPEWEPESELELVLNATSNLLSHAHNKAWMELPPCDRSKTATRLLVGMEMISEILAKVTNRQQSIMKTAPEIEGLNINIINTTETELHVQQSSIKFNVSDLHLEISFEDVKRQASKNGLGCTAFIQYKNIEKWLQSNVTAENKSYVGPSIITKVFSASIFPREKHRTKLNSSIRFTMLHKISPNSSNVSCVFWDFSTDDFVGHWSDEGCKVVSYNDHNTTCECDHLTHFAILMSSVDKKISPENEFALQIITYIGCTISIMCLALSLFTFCFFRNLQCDRNTIHKNLVFSLLIAQLIFVFGINQYDKKTLCAVIAGFLHYFFLAAFAWMCLEGVQLYILLVEVFEIEKSRVKWYYLGGYGTPALIVVLTSLSAMVVSPLGASGAYGTEKHCWLNIKDGFIWAFNGPVIAVFTVNLVVLGLTISIMCKHASTASWKLKNKSKIHEIGSWLRGAAVIMMLLGTTWIFGIFVNFDNHTIVFEYIFATLKSLQGLFIFIFYCLTNDQVRTEYERAFQRSTCLPEWIRAKYGDMSKGGVLSTPNQPKPSKKTTVRLISSSPKDEICQRRIRTTSVSPRLADSLGIGSLGDSDNLESTEDSNAVPESAIAIVNNGSFSFER